jgi:hypothetical protein
LARPPKSVSACRTTCKYCMERTKSAIHL